MLFSTRLYRRMLVILHYLLFMACAVLFQLRPFANPSIGPFVGLGLAWALSAALVIRAAWLQLRPIRRHHLDERQERLRAKAYVHSYWIALAVILDLCLLGNHGWLAWSGLWVVSIHPAAMVAWLQPDCPVEVKEQVLAKA